MRGLLRVVVAVIIVGTLASCGTGAEQPAPSQFIDPTLLQKLDPACVDPVGLGKAESCPTPQDVWSEQDIYNGLLDEIEYEQERQRTSVYTDGGFDCDDFTARSEAQAYLEANPADADYLDGDGDGIACEWGT